jgi:hypothetical protein
MTSTLRKRVRISSIANAVSLLLFLYVLLLNCGVGTTKGLAYTTAGGHCFGIFPFETGVNLFSAYPSDRPLGWEVYSYPWPSLMYNPEFSHRALGFRWGKGIRVQLAKPFSKVRITIWQVMIPLWAFGIIFGALPAKWTFSYWRRRQRKLNGRCIECGYDLRMSATRCPECGAETLDNRSA